MCLAFADGRGWEDGFRRRSVNGEWGGESTSDEDECSHIPATAGCEREASQSDTSKTGCCRGGVCPRSTDLLLDTNEGQSSLPHWRRMAGTRHSAGEGEEQKVFLLMEGQTLLLAPENMRMATREEMSMSETVKDEVADLGDMLRDPTKSNIFQDLRGPPPPRRRRVVKRRKVVQPREEPTGEDKEVKRAREVEEEAPERKRAKLMMKGTKTVRKILQDRVQRMIQMGILRRQQPRPRRMKALAAPVQQPPAAPERAAPEGERRLAIEDGEIPEEAVDAILEPNTHEDEWRQRLQQMTSDERRQLSLDDYPFPRKRGPEDEIESPDLKRRRIGESLVAGIRDVYYEEGGDPGRANEWISRFELGLLRRLTGLPVTAARLHNEPRKKFQRPPRRSGKWCREPGRPFWSDRMEEMPTSWRRLQRRCHIFQHDERLWNGKGWPSSTRRMRKRNRPSPRSTWRWRMVSTRFQWVRRRSRSLKVCGWKRWRTSWWQRCWFWSFARMARSWIRSGSTRQRRKHSKRVMRRNGPVGLKTKWSDECLEVRRRMCLDSTSSRHPSEWWGRTRQEHFCSHWWQRAV